MDWQGSGEARILPEPRPVDGVRQPEGLQTDRGAVPEAEKPMTDQVIPVTTQIRKRNTTAAKNTKEPLWREKSSNPEAGIRQAGLER